MSFFFLANHTITVCIEVQGTAPKMKKNPEKLNITQSMAGFFGSASSSKMRSKC